VQRQVDGDAPALPGQRLDDVAPEIGVGGQAVDEERHRPGSGVDVAELAGPGLDGMPVRVEFMKLHGGHPPS
jgi:hypothetical protein